MILILSIHLLATGQSQRANAAPKTLYADPICHGAADPGNLWNKRRKCWWMFYTNRRANMAHSTSVEWVPGTRIGIAESKDGLRWNYRDTADIAYRAESGNTFRAPEIMAEKNIYHIDLTYIPGILPDWNHPREIIRLTATDCSTGS